MNPQFPVALENTMAPTLMWANPDDIETAALEQIRNIAALPWVLGVRLMPDVHLGKGATVGSVIAMKDAVSPSAVGVDIGCGMIGVRTNLTINDLPEDLGPLRSQIESAIPVGFKSHSNVGLNLEGVPDAFLKGFTDLRADTKYNHGRVFNQVGTLGGGNHFIELCSDDHGVIWLQLHSGSRNIGKVLAEWHIAEAKTLEHNLNLPDRDLAVFLASTAEMENYLHDLTWAQEYARHNRAVMMRFLTQVVGRYFAALGKDVVFEEVANVHHNYVKTEIIDGQELIVTRKGAIRATEGEYGLIPGSMGTGSYIVKGLGNPESFYSASHGAGRRMSRTQAKKRFTEQDLAEQTQGIECRKDFGVVDEIPSAYKDLESVIAAQTDLIEVVVRLTTLLCVKG